MGFFIIQAARAADVQSQITARIEGLTVSDVRTDLSCPRRAARLRDSDSPGVEFRIAAAGRS